MFTSGENIISARFIKIREKTLTCLLIILVTHPHWAFKKRFKTKRITEVAYNHCVSVFKEIDITFIPYSSDSLHSTTIIWVIKNN